MIQIYYRSKPGISGSVVEENRNAGMLKGSSSCLEGGEGQWVSSGVPSSVKTTGFPFVLPIGLTKTGAE